MNAQGRDAAVEYLSDYQDCTAHVAAAARLAIHFISCATSFGQ